MKANDIEKIIEDARALLKYNRLMGVREVFVPAKKTDVSDVSTDTSKEEKLKELRAYIGDCTRCKLHKGRTKLVFGTGNPTAQLFFIGEAPGADEDIQGEPFVGRAGQLLTKIIEAMGLKRSQVYITNIVKCRPPQNRNPEPDEIATCNPFLAGQIEIVAPKAIICLGKIAASVMLKTEEPITKLRGKIGEYKNIPVMPTFHPAYLLRNPPAKKEVWEDVKAVMKILA